MPGNKLKLKKKILVCKEVASDILKNEQSGKITERQSVQKWEGKRRTKTSGRLKERSTKSLSLSLSDTHHTVTQADTHRGTLFVSLSLSQLVHDST